jgi:hypothetical protein
MKSIFWMLNFDILFGNNCVSYQSVQTYEGYKHFAFILFLSHQNWLSWLFLLVIVALATYSLFRRSYYLGDLIIYLLVLNVNTKTWTTLTAGDPLLANLCVLSIFLRKDFASPTNAWGEIKVLLHNFSFMALVVQVCVVYFYSALAKWNDGDWTSGNAIHYINRTLHYSNHFLAAHADSFYYASFILTYLVLIYQTIFPLFVFVPKIKKYFLHLGVLMHLYIAVVMGLVFFGLIMALTYVLFYDFKSPADRADFRGS